MEKIPKFSKMASSELQSKINTSIIFNYIREYGPMSRIKISEDLGISPSAVSRVVDRLIIEGYIVEAGKVKTKSVKGGKRPTLLEVRKDMGYVIGVDLGKEKLKIAMANFNGEVIGIYKGFRISNEKDIAEKSIEEIKKVLMRYQQQYSNIKSSNLRSICIGIPASIDKESGGIIDVPLYSKWKDLNFKQIISSEFNVPVCVENDVNLSALGEKYYGKGRNYNNLIFVEISNGIGAGIIIDNQLYRGSEGLAGEIGFTIVDTKNLCFKVKNKGFLEEIISIDGIRKKAINEIKKGRKTIITEIVKDDINLVEPRIIFEAAIQGDKLAGDIINETVDYLSITIINLILAINPQYIVVGGDICILPDVERLILEPLREKIKNPIPFKLPEIEMASLGEDAGILGASYNAIDSLIIEKFPYKIEGRTSSAK
ncbi:MAG: ROK family transcriptional regulator [Actinomycetota bacterium]|nr:ROK family transcriptional regulator [Actinomycetota bacterium]